MHISRVGDGSYSVLVHYHIPTLGSLQKMRPSHLLALFIFLHSILFKLPYMCCLCCELMCAHLWMSKFVCHAQSPGTSFLEGHEAFIFNSCFVVGGVQSLLVTSEADVIPFGPGKEAKLFIPNGAIPRGHELQVRYAYLLDGPFTFPENYNVVSPVLYIDYNTSLVKKPLELHLHHWYAGEDRQKKMTFLKAPHVAQEGGVFHFAKYTQGLFSDDEQFAVLDLEEDLCCVVVAVMNTGNLPHPVHCRLHHLKKVQSSGALSFRLFVTYAHSAWTEVCPVISH